MRYSLFFLAACVIGSSVLAADQRPSRAAELKNVVRNQAMSNGLIASGGRYWFQKSDGGWLVWSGNCWRSSSTMAPQATSQGGRSCSITPAVPVSVRSATFLSTPEDQDWYFAAGPGHYMN